LLTELSSLLLLLLLLLILHAYNKSHPCSRNRSRRNSFCVSIRAIQSPVIHFSPTFSKRIHQTL